MTTSFSQAVLQSIPSGITVPQPVVDLIRWVETEGLDRCTDDGYRYALLNAESESSCLAVNPADPDVAKAWTGNDDPAICNRLAPIFQTGGDGSCAALWQDDDGNTQIVHLGSGSGSTMIGVMADDPVDLLRAMAIGYDELCWPDYLAMTPEEIFLEENPDAEDDPEGYDWPAKPAALRQWVSEKFATAIPERASEVLRAMPDMDDEDSSDPFAIWLNKVRG